MTALVVGVTHRSAPAEVLEAVSRSTRDTAALLNGACASRSVSEALAVATCHRLELHVEADAYHPAVEDLTELLAGLAGLTAVALEGHLHVRWGDEALSHLVRVAAGLDSAVAGDAQVVGQLRTAYATAQARGAAGPALHRRVQAALRAAKRVRATTGIDAAGASTVDAALDLAGGGRPDAWAGARAVVVGAGSLGSLAASRLALAGVADLAVVNRTPQAAERVAAQHGGRALPTSALPGLLADADLLLTCTGAADLVVTAADVDVALTAPARSAGRRLHVVDLALPRDVDPSVGGRDDVVLVDLEHLREVLDARPTPAAVTEAERLAAEEVLALAATERSTLAAPTVAALRERASAAVAEETDRLARRLPDLDPATRAEVERSLSRLVGALLHEPSVQVRRLAAEPGGEGWPSALARLFDLPLDEDAPRRLAPAPAPAPPGVRA